MLKPCTGQSRAVGWVERNEAHRSNWNLISSTDAAGAETQYRYDSKGNIVQIIDAAGKTTALAYDGANNLIAGSILRIEPERFVAARRNFVFRLQT